MSGAVISTAAPAIGAHSSIFDSHGGSFNFGVVTVTYTFSFNPVEVTGTITILGVTLAKYDLDVTNPGFDINISFGGFGVDGKIFLDIPNKNLEATLNLTTPFGNKSWTGTLTHW